MFGVWNAVTLNEGRYALIQVCISEPLKVQYKIKNNHNMTLVLWHLGYDLSVLNNFLHWLLERSKVFLPVDTFKWILSCFNLMGQIDESVSILEACEKSAACRRNTKLVSRRIKHYEKSGTFLDKTNIYFEQSQIFLDDSDTFEDFFSLKLLFFSQESIMF